MMFKKYISKISNTIGTVNYLQQKTIEKKHRSTRHQSLFDDGYDVVDVDPSTINKMEIDLSASGSRRHSMLDSFPENAQIVLSAAIAKLRNTLFFYPLVLHFISFLFLSTISRLLYFVIVVFGLVIKHIHSLSLSHTRIHTRSFSSIPQTHHQFLRSLHTLCANVFDRALLCAKWLRNVCNYRFQLCLRHCLSRPLRATDPYFIISISIFRWWRISHDIASVYYGKRFIDLWPFRVKYGLSIRRQPQASRYSVSTQRI